MIMKRMLAGLASLALVCSSNAVAFTAIADDNVKTADEGLIVKNEDSEEIKNQIDTFKNNLRIELGVDWDWCSSFNNWKINLNNYNSDLSMSDCEIKFYYKTQEKNENWGSYLDDDVKSLDVYERDSLENYSFAMQNKIDEDLNVIEGDNYIKVWAVVNGEFYNSEGAVGPVELVLEADSVNYKYDKTEPNDFNLTYEKKDNDRWKVKNATSIRDNLSRELDIRYTVNKPLYEKWEDINQNSQGIGLNGENFEFDCDANSNITVYVKDRAGNINHSSIFVYDGSKDLLEVSGIENKWVNTLQDWKIKNYYNDDIKIYYTTSKTDNSWEYGNNYDLKNAKLWGNDMTAEKLKNVIPEEDHYVHFWLVYKNDEIDKKEYTCKEYKFDKTQPGTCTLVKEGKSIYEVTVRNSTGVTDSTSGMKKEVIYQIREKGKNVRQGQAESEIRSDGKLYFWANLNRWEIIGKEVYFKVSDNADNPRGYTYSDSDSKAPEIYEDGAKIVSAEVNAEGKIINEKTKSANDFYEEDEEAEKSSIYEAENIYASKNDYIKIAVKEMNPSRIKVSINGKVKEENSFYFYPEKDEYKKLIFIKDGNDPVSRESDIYYCYIPLKECEKYLNIYDVNKIKLEVWDISNNTTSIDDPKAAVSFFYDNVDPNIGDLSSVGISKEKTIKLDKQWCYNAESDQTDVVSAPIDDEIGLRKYTVTIEEKSIENEKQKEPIQTYEKSVFDKKTKKVSVTETVDEEEIEKEITKIIRNTDYNIEQEYDTLAMLKEGYSDDFKLEDGHYTLKIRVEDIAGNFKEVTQDICIDTEAPVIDSYKYEYEPSVLNFLSFGIFGKESVNFKVAVFDRTCGVNDKEVNLIWNDDVTIQGKRDGESVDFYFNELPINKSGNPKIVLKDKIGNTSTYYFTSKDDKSLTNNIDESTLLELEDEKPTATVVLPKEGQQIIDGEIWYPEEVEVSVAATDEQSGLSSVYYKEDEIHKGTDTYNIEGENVTVEIEYTTPVREKNEDILDYKKNPKASYSYTIKKSGNYLLTADAMDNAGNKASDAKTETDNDETGTPSEKPKSEKITVDPIRQKVIHIDLEDPRIENITLNDIAGNTVEPDSDKYGLFFNQDTIVRVYVKDDGVSSGINYVDLYKLDVNGKESSLRIFSNDTQYYHDGENAYAEFTVEKGFKGKIWALTADKVALENPVNFRHTSGYVYIDGTIVEGEELHAELSDIIVTEKETTDKRDYDGIPLYNKDIPLSVRVNDSFSGIRKVEWSIGHDNKSGVIEANLDGSIISNSEDAVVIYETDKDEEKITNDKNIITGFSFNITVLSETNNVNNNEVRITLTDNAGNESTVIKHYSIDTTVPVITAELSNKNASNERYYNTGQTVTVSVRERNFDPADLELTISRYDESSRRWNRYVQSVSNWSSNGEGDDTIHTGSFAINDDGNYSYDISFTDMAGNRADMFNQSDFVIDRTAPVLRTNFDEFKTGKELNFFGCDSINKVARIIITEHNFSPDSANVVIMKKEPGSEHNTYSMTASSAYGWKNNGDEHILEIPFKEGDDGVYLIKVSPVDLALNTTESQSTVVFEVDFTKPVIAERNGEYVQDDAKNYEELEIYNDKNKAEEGFIPSIGFSDTNFDHLVYDLTVYTPVYKNGKELKSTTIDKETKQMIVDTDMLEQGQTISETVYSLPEFEKEGVYSVDIIAVDKAGNKSRLCKNTFVMMKNSDVLAYISNSNKANGEGWYSLQKDENTPISKRPDSFSDLDITVFAQEDSETHIILRDENGTAKDTGITAENSSDMYAVGVYNYRLPKEYFAENYPDGTNKDLYLWAENTKDNEASHITLGWIRIDAVAPTCHIPSDLKKNKSFIKSKKTYKLTAISESLDKTKCMVYDNGEAVSQDSFEYSDLNDTLSYTLDKGWHDLSFVLVDEAGNAYTIKEVSFIQVGLFYCMWFRILCGIVAAIIIAGCVVLIRRKIKNRY